MDEIKSKANPEQLGMILVHNGVVRATGKHGNTVRGMLLSYDKWKLQSMIEDFSSRDGIAAIKAWINEGSLSTGDDIMYVLVAGRFRTDVLPVFEELISKIKKEIVTEREQ